jgi:hypothetical protein
VSAVAAEPFVKLQSIAYPGEGFSGPNFGVVMAAENGRMVAVLASDPAPDRVRSTCIR